MSARRRDAGKNGLRKGPWSQQEIERLKRMYPQRRVVQIATELNRSKQSVERMIQQIWPGEPRTGPWTATEVQELRSYWGAAELKDIARRLGRSEHEILRKVESLEREVNSRPWRSRDVQELKRHYGTRGQDDLRVILGRPIEDIERKAAELCLAKDKGFQRRRGGGKAVRMPRWSPEEIERLRRLYPEHSNLEIAKIIGRSEKSIISKAHDLKLKKSEDRLQAMGRDNVRRRYDARDGDDAGTEEAGAVDGFGGS